MRIYLVVDGSNFFFTQRDYLGWKADPRLLKKYVERWGDVTQAAYYLTVPLNDSDGRQMRFRTALHHMGYSVVPIPVKVIQSDNGSSKEKADADVKIALDVFMALDTFDMFVLVSGDSDFCYLLEQLKARGKLVKVISTKGIVANELLECVGPGFCDFNDIKEHTEHHND